MPATPGRPAPIEKVQIQCLCGQAHGLARARVVERLGRERWKCTHCKRRFIIACSPGPEGVGETFWPIFLDDVPVRGDTQEMGLAVDGAASGEVPERLAFECRCGCRLVGESKIYGRRTRCPKCNLRLIVRVGYQSESGKPIALLEYVEEDQSKP